MSKKDLSNPELFINRELSWLEFNQRVLDEGLSSDTPLLERLKFLAIVSSNLDEFFMVRVAGLVQQRGAGVRKKDISGMTAKQQLDQICDRAHEMVRDQTAAIKDVLGQLKPHGINLIRAENWTDNQKKYLQNYFISEIMPILTPVAVHTNEPVFYAAVRIG